MRDRDFSRVVLCWIFPYINGRKQKVVFKAGDESDWLHTNFGIPQGSVLGALLFFLYINYLKHILRIEGMTILRKTRTINYSISSTLTISRSICGWTVSNFREVSLL